MKWKYSCSGRSGQEMFILIRGIDSDNRTESKRCASYYRGIMILGEQAGFRQRYPGYNEHMKDVKNKGVTGLTT